MRKDYDEPIRWDRWGFRNPAACFETLPSSRGGVSKHATETTALECFHQVLVPYASRVPCPQGLCGSCDRAETISSSAYNKYPLSH